MRRIIVAVALALAAAPGLAGQNAGQDYAGIWIAEHAGTTFARLELTADRGALAGRLGLGNIEVDKQGQVSKVTSAPKDLTPLSQVAVRESRLTFSLKEGESIDQFQMRIVGSSAAELEYLPTDAFKKELAADGIPVPKPILLKKVAR